MFSSSNLESSSPEYHRALGVHMLVQSMHFIDDDTGAKEIARELSPRSDGWKKVEYRTESRFPYCQSRFFSLHHLHSHHVFVIPHSALDT